MPSSAPQHGVGAGSFERTTDRGSAMTIPALGLVCKWGYRERGPAHCREHGAHGGEPNIALACYGMKLCSRGGTGFGTGVGFLRGMEDS
jgi:hypothetical protein